MVRDVEKGIGVGYGHFFKTQRKSKLAVVAIGYADGVSRNLSGKISASIDGVLVPQVGAIAMDQMVFDITDKPDIKTGQVLTLLGTDGEVLFHPKIGVICLDQFHGKFFVVSEIDFLELSLKICRGAQSKFFEL